MLAVSDQTERPYPEDVLSARVVPWDEQYGVAVVLLGGKRHHAYFVGDAEAAEAEVRRLTRTGQNSQ